MVVVQQRESSQNHISHQKTTKKVRAANKLEALENIELIIAEGKRLEIDVRYTHQPHGGTLHVMLEHSGLRVLDWWPATGTTARDGCKLRKATGFSDVLSIAQDLLKGKTSMKINEIEAFASRRISDPQGTIDDLVKQTTRQGLAIRVLTEEIKVLKESAVAHDNIPPWEE